MLNLNTFILNPYKNDMNNNDEWIESTQCVNVRLHNSFHIHVHNADRNWSDLQIAKTNLLILYVENINTNLNHTRDPGFVLV